MSGWMIGTDRRMSSPLVPARRAIWPNGEWGYIARYHMLGPKRPEAVLPDRVLYLPTLSHFLIANNPLSLALSLSPSLSLSLSLSLSQPSVTF